VSPTYLCWGLILWSAFVLTRMEDGKPPPRIDTSYNLTIALAAFTTLMVTTWPVTLPLALVGRWAGHRG
jgi:hypothetical protein